MTPIMQATALGYSEDEILKYLSKLAPSLSKSISKAVGAGHSASSILGFISKTMSDDEHDPSLSQEAGHKKVASRREKITKDLLKTAVATGTFYGVSKALPAAIQGVKGAFQGQKEVLPSIPTPKIGPTPMANAPIKPPGIPKPSQAPIPNPALLPSEADEQLQTQQGYQQSNLKPAQAPPPPPQERIVSPEASVRIIDQLGVANQIKNLQKIGNSPEAIATAVSVSLKPSQKKWLEEQVKSGAAKPLEETINDFISSSNSQVFNASPELKQYAVEQYDQGDKRPIDEMRKEFEKRQSKQSPLMRGIEEDVERMQGNINKGDSVSTAGGIIGNVESVRNKEALVKDENGKLHKIKSDELVSVPEDLVNKNYESIAQSYFDTFPKEGEGSLSDALSIMAYDPEKNELVAAFPDSPNFLYTYKNVEPELYEEIISASTKPKTSGGTGLPGTWDVNTADSRGSPFKKISENKEKYPFTKLSVGYNMFGKLSQAVKEMRKQKRKAGR